MKDLLEAAATETLKIGPDQVTIKEGQVIIEARHEMEDWTVSEFVRRPIFFRDQKYYLRQRSAAQPPFAMRYVLAPWPADDHSSSKRFFTYDEDVVAEREKAIKADLLDGGVHYLLIGLSPLLGFLWSGTKERLTRFGLSSRSLTSRSIYLGFVLMLTELSFIQMMSSTSIRSGRLALGGIIRAFAGVDSFQLGSFQVYWGWVDVALTLVLAIDSVIRFSQHLKSDDGVSPWGLLEWLKTLMPSKPKQ